MKNNQVYQFKISLNDIAPVIWRRIQVPAQSSFWDLHVAIQDAMGWQDYHLHLFSIKRPHAHRVTEIGIEEGETLKLTVQTGASSTRELTASRAASSMTL